MVNWNKNKEPCGRNLWNEINWNLKDIFVLNYKFCDNVGRNEENQKHHTKECTIWIICQHSMNQTCLQLTLISISIRSINLVLITGWASSQKKSVMNDIHTDKCEEFDIGFYFCSCVCMCAYVYKCIKSVPIIPFNLGISFHNILVNIGFTSGALMSKS